MGSNHRSSNGPDAMDVATAIVAIENLHGVSVSLEMSRGGVYGEAGLTIVAIATRKVVDNGGVRRSVSRRHRFPNNDSATLEGCLFKLVHELDRDCSTFWTQAELPAA